jgi:hypothetical protein
MEKGRIIPVCEIGYDMEEPFGNYFSGHDIIDSSKIKKTSLPNVVNKLVYDSDGNREEWNSRVPERLSLEDIDNDVDAVLMNFISGDDFGIEDIARFRERLFSAITIVCPWAATMRENGFSGNIPNGGNISHKRILCR